MRGYLQFSKQEKPVDIENRPEADRIMASGMNTPEIVDGASQVPLSRSFGRARGHSGVLGLGDEAMLPDSASRTLRSSISKNEGLLDRDSTTNFDTTNTVNGQRVRPMRRESVMSARSAYTVRGNGKQKQEEPERSIPREDVN